MKKLRRKMIKLKLKSATRFVKDKERVNENKRQRETFLRTELKNAFENMKRVEYLKCIEK